MLRQLFSTAIRNAKRDIFFTLINIGALAAGMACSLVIFVYVYSEWTFDRHFNNADRIYRVGVGFFGMGPFASGPEILIDFLSNKVNGIESCTGFQKNDEELIFDGNQSFKDAAYYVDSSFFKVFSYNFIDGRAASPFENEGSVVVTDRLAQKIFGHQDVIGEMLQLGQDRVPYQISAVVKESASKSHLLPSLWVLKKSGSQLNTSWTAATNYIYLKTAPSYTINDLNAALDKINKTSISPALGSDKSFKFVVQPLTDIHLKSSLSYEISPGGNETNLYILSAVAILILTIALFNFINLSTVIAIRRAKEIGVKKTFGASRKKLFYQFMYESQLISFCALVVCLVLSKLFIDNFAWITGSYLSISPEMFLENIPWLILFSITVGILSGLYPALYMTAFNPLNTLKGDFKTFGRNSLRKILMSVQFSIAVILIISSIIINRQLEFVSAKDLGFKPENVIVVENLYDLTKDQAILLRDRIANLPGVVEASLHRGEPAGKGFVFSDGYTSPTMQDAINMSTYFTDNNYLEVLGYNLIRGRNFSKSQASDSTAVILNESAVRALKLEGDPTGQLLNNGLTIVGVVTDFHTESLRQQISPIVFRLPNPRISKTIFAQLSVKVKEEQDLMVKSIAESWNQVGVRTPFEYHFLESNFESIANKERYLLRSISLFTTLAIVISCLGLAAIAAYTVEQRRKEISIRKVLGSSTLKVVYTVNKELLIMLLVSAVIAIPVAVSISKLWLNNFAYRIFLSPWYFIAGAVLISFIAAITISFNSYRIARKNPTRYLRES